MIANIAGVPVTKTHVPGPEGVRGRNSDNTSQTGIAMGATGTVGRRAPTHRLLDQEQVIELASRYSFVIATFPPLPRTKERLNPSAKNTSKF
jgi:hypothetical protein